MTPSRNKPWTRTKALQRVFLFAVVVFLARTGPLSADTMKVASEQTVTTFNYPESVAYDPEAKVLYVSEFGSQLKPTLKEGKGRISKVSLNGKVLEKTFLPASGATLNKPKGIWVIGSRLWVTDIDAAWIFDLKTIMVSYTRSESQLGSLNNKG